LSTDRLAVDVERRRDTSYSPRKAGPMSHELAAAELTLEDEACVVDVSAFF